MIIEKEWLYRGRRFRIRLEPYTGEIVEAEGDPLVAYAVRDIFEYSMRYFDLLKETIVERVERSRGYHRKIS